MKLYENTSKCLHKVCEDVPSSLFGTSDFREYTQKMFRFMKERGGMGLAVPQIGANLRLFIMSDGKIEFVCANPHIIKVSEDKMEWGKEECLSFPHLELTIKRPSFITITYFDVDGILQAQEFDGIWARCFLHEFDHIEGIVFTDKVGKTKLSMAQNKQRRKLKLYKKSKGRW